MLPRATNFCLCMILNRKGQVSKKGALGIIKYNFDSDHLGLKHTSKKWIQKELLVTFI